MLQQRGYTLLTGGTDNHLVLLDLVDKGLTGKKAENVLEQANITTNKNMVPNDPQSPFVTSGVRLGTPAITTRGFKEKQAQQVAHWIADVLDESDSSAVITRVQQEVLDVCQQFPVYDGKTDHWS